MVKLSSLNGWNILFVLLNGGYSQFPGAVSAGFEVAPPQPFVERLLELAGLLQQTLEPRGFLTVIYLVLVPPLRVIGHLKDEMRKEKNARKTPEVVTE